MSDSSPTTLSAERAAGVLRSQREDALLGIATPLWDARGPFGPPLLPLTPWHHLLLLGYANPCFCGGPRTLPAILQYLWICSPSFRPASPLRFGLFAWRWQFAVSTWERVPGRARLVRVPTMRAIHAIEAHTAVILRDRPPLVVVKKPKKEASASHEAGVAHELATLELICRRHITYTRAEFWHTGYGHTNQLLALHFATSAPSDAPKFDPARDKAKGDILRARLAKRSAASPSLNSQPSTLN